ncbi:hypothetical protein OWV82_017960 [Melia azedarach]|uniref:Uncharacterized protein n=1 Tax=Melia azedarach TaxID=155640 RepID=A0ACC1XA62_MELAZ|nr:hypothetical protein OWV82_017960 [Melia azedarach]
MMVDGTNVMVDGTILPNQMVGKSQVIKTLKEKKWKLILKQHEVTMDTRLQAQILQHKFYLYHLQEDDNSCKRVQ